MSLTLVTFWKRLLDSGLIDATTPPLWAQSFSQDHGSSLPSDPLSLAKWLVATSRINRFCARQCCHEKWTSSPLLRVAGVVRAGAKAPEPFATWVPVNFVPSHSGSAQQKPVQSSSGILLALPASSLQQNDGELLRRHAMLTHPRLAAVQLVPMPAGSFSSVEELNSPDVLDHPTIGAASVGWALSIPTDFKPCWSANTAGSQASMSLQALATTLAELCDAVSVMHVGGLTHNHIGARSVWRGEDGSVLLLRDPLEILSPDVSTALGQSRPSLTEVPNNLQANGSPVGDIAAIGRLGYLLRYQKTIPTDLLELPAELSDAVAAGALGDPLDRVLAYAISPDVSARFPSTESLGKALQAVAKAVVASLAPVSVPRTKTAPPPVPKPQALPPQPRSIAKDPRLDLLSQPSEPTVAILPSAPTPIPMAEDRVTVPAAPKRLRRRRNQSAIYVLSALCVPVFVLMIAVLVQDPTASRPEPELIVRPRPDVLPSIASTSTVNPTPELRPSASDQVDPSEETISRYQVTDRNELLWAPPEAVATTPVGPSPRLATALLPPGPAAILVVDLPRLMQLNLLSAWKLETDPWLAELQARSGISLDAIGRVAVALFPGSSGVPDLSMAVVLNQPTPLSQLTTAWEASPGRAPSGATIFSSGELDAPIYFPLVDGDESGEVPSAESLVDAFAFGPLNRITEVAETDGAAIVLPRQFEELWSKGNDGDAIRFLSNPNFLVADARQWTAAASPDLLTWIKSNLIPDCGGLLVRIAPGLESTGYLELRLSVAPGADPSALSARVGGQLKVAKQTAEEFLLTRQIDPSWRLLAGRLPAMWSFMARQTRSGRSEGQLIWNAYLPDQAIGQWSLATLLAANTAPATGVVATAPTAEKLTVAQMLDRPMSISFDQESLQFAIETIAKQFAEDLPPGNTMPPVTILGNDLQKNGITQNQQVRDFNKQSIPLRQVLTDLVLGANPDRTATGPADEKQSLIWVVDGEGTDAKILITTRDAATGKYELPVEFQTKP